MLLFVVNINRIILVIRYECRYLAVVLVVVLSFFLVVVAAGIIKDKSELRGNSSKDRAKTSYHMARHYIVFHPLSVYPPMIMMIFIRDGRSSSVFLFSCLYYHTIFGFVIS